MEIFEKIVYALTDFYKNPLPNKLLRFGGRRFLVIIELRAGKSCQPSRNAEMTLIGRSNNPRKLTQFGQKT
jgi:hypothetical protein